MAEPRLRRAGNPGEVENVVDDFVTQGYEILERGENSVMLRKKSWGTGVGHFVVAIFTLWWTIGLGNVLYALFAHYTAEKVLVKYTPPTGTAHQEPAEGQ